MPICSCPSLSLHYDVQGEGPSLLLLSGLGGGTWSWYGQIPFFSRTFRTLCFDNRGAGRSSMPPGPYRMRDFAEDALCLLDRLEIASAFVMGLSMGGMIAQELVLLAPERVRALVLGCTHSGGASCTPPERRVIEILTNNTGLSHEQILQKNLPLFFSETFRKEHPELTAAYCKAQMSVSLQPAYALEAQLTAISTFDCADRLSQITVPTLVVTGSKDVLVPRENARFLAQHIPGAQLVEIPNAGHALHAECRDQLNALAFEFFNRVASGSAGG